MDATLPASMSGSIRLFVTPALSEGAEVAATPQQAHYLAHVMRRAIGDAVVLFNGADGEWQAQIATLRRDRAVFTVGHRLRPQAPEADIWLAFAPLKRDATDLLVQKATELGAAVLLPVATARTNAARINPQRLTAIAIEAAEQCERLTVPRIHDLIDLPSLLRDWPDGRPLVVAMERQPAPHAGIAAGPSGLLVGPEGGFTERELDVLRSRPFVVPASLGPLILRAETAAIVGLALLQAHSPVTRDGQTG
jgi:16S rRNA (uracil1498-N3)-methyltransferase